MTVAALDVKLPEVTDADELKRFLVRDRVANAYLLGDLDPAYLPYCTWYGGRTPSGELGALVLVYEGLRLPAVLTVAPPCADSADQDAIKSGLGMLDEVFTQVRHALPREFWVHAWEHHRLLLDRHFEPGALKPMIRMGLTRQAYRRQASDVAVRRLGHVDTARIMALYGYFPDHFFEPYQLESGLYFGVDGDDGQSLAAIAGIHVHSRSHDIAAIGNLVTHPDYRRRGHATAVTTVLLDALFETVSLVTLNVEKTNVAAIKTFEKFGFTRHHVYYEGRVETRR